jgi:hypothetical protein
MKVAGMRREQLDMLSKGSSTEGFFVSYGVRMLTDHTCIAHGAEVKMVV